MIISRWQDANATVYQVCADVKETNGKNPHPIVTFDDLETAVLVLKYMRGDRMDKEDIAIARDAIRNN